MDLISSNLQATNTKFNSILSGLESTKADALANLETTASTATSPEILFGIAHTLHISSNHPHSNSQARYVGVSLPSVARSDTGSVRMYSIPDHSPPLSADYHELDQV